MANGKNGNGRKGGNGRGNGDQSRKWTGIALDIVLTGVRYIGIGAAMGFGGHVANRFFPNPKSGITSPISRNKIPHLTKEH